MPTSSQEEQCTLNKNKFIEQYQGVTSALSYKYYA
jgi:hypothetical protein